MRTIDDILFQGIKEESIVTKSSKYVSSIIKNFLVSYYVSFLLFVNCFIIKSMDTFSTENHHTWYTIHFYSVQNQNQTSEDLFK